MRQGTAGHDQQFQCIVKNGRIAASLHQHRLDFVQIISQQSRGLSIDFPGPHAVDVAAQGIDLAVVGHIPERLGQVPGGHGVGAVALVHQRKRGGKVLLRQIGVIGRHLGPGQQPLVDDDPARQTADIKRICLFVSPACDLFFNLAPDDIELALKMAQGHPAGSDKKLAYQRLGRFGQITQMTVTGRHHPPAEHLARFLFDNILDCFHAFIGQCFPDRQKEHAHGIDARLRQRKAHSFIAQHLIRNLQHEAGAVPRAGVATNRAAMLQIDQGLQGKADNVMLRRAVHPGDKTNAAAVVLKPGII